MQRCTGVLRAGRRGCAILQCLSRHLLHRPGACTAAQSHRPHISLIAHTICKQRCSYCIHQYLSGAAVRSACVTHLLHCAACRCQPHATAASPCCVPLLITCYCWLTVLHASPLYGPVGTRGCCRGSPIVLLPTQQHCTAALTRLHVGTGNLHLLVCGDSRVKPEYTWPCRCVRAGAAFGATGANLHMVRRYTQPSMPLQSQPQIPPVPH